MKIQKKILTLLLLLCMITGISACGNKEKVNDKNINLPETESQEETFKAENDEIQVLAMEQTRKMRYEWAGNLPIMLARSEYSSVTLEIEDAEKYPEMAETLEQLSGMVNNSMEDEFDNLLSLAKEVYPQNPENFETYVSKLDTQVRRADSVVVSLLSDSYSDYGNIRDFRGFHGSNFDTKTGKELELSDVILDMSKVPEIVEKELDSNMWTADLYSETAVADYFKNTPADGISWTLDYNGVTFYFEAGAFAEEGAGRSTATISFAGYPELFVKKYMEVPEAYMVNVPLNSSFFADLNDDGDWEEFIVSGTYDEYSGCYFDFGVYTKIDGSCYDEEYYAYDYHPYYVKTKDNGHFLYLFCEEAEEFNRCMSLVVLDLADGKVTKAGEMQAGPYYRQKGSKLEDVFAVPTNPEKLYLDDFEDPTRFYTFDHGVYQHVEDPIEFMVGADGIPVNLSQDETNDGEVVQVSTIREFLDAIAPDRHIIIAPGHYDMSETLEVLWEEQGERWNAEHEYVQLRQAYDGTEIVIQNVTNLTIAGGTISPNDTELYIQPRYGAVLNFIDCQDICLMNLMMGHAETGDCSGNVVNFSGCRNVSLHGMDLYGCGVFGIGTDRGTGDLFVYSSTIRDCMMGPFDLTDGNGKFEFHNCTLTDSGKYAYYEMTDHMSLAFYECLFGKYETEYFYFAEDIYTEDCIWADEIETYPEYGYDIEESETVFDPDNWEMTEVNAAMLGDTNWLGYAKVYIKSGETQYYPIRENGVDLTPYFQVNADGTGWMNDGNVQYDFTWYCISNYSVCFELQNGQNLYASLYADPADDSSACWMMLQMDEKIIWFY